MIKKFRKMPEEIKQILNKGKKNIVNWERVYFKPKNDKYPLIRVNGVLTPEHIYIWEINFGEIPKGYVIHHKNKDKKDNRIENLEMMPLREHIRLHNKKKKD